MSTPPNVDDADVMRMIDFMFGKSINMNISPEERAECAHQVALGIATAQGTSRAYAEAFAQKVRARALWLEKPTGGVVEFPE